jgi:hypothetical protein
LLRRTSIGGYLFDTREADNVPRLPEYVDKLLRLKEHPVVVILLWVPTIALLPGDWITVGGAIAENSNLTRLLLALAGLAAILYVSGRWPFGSLSKQRADKAALCFDSIEVGKSRRVEETNVFTDSWNGAPVVFNLINPQGSAAARDVRPTVTVKDLKGRVLAGPTNGRWANPQAPKTEEVERNIPANGAPVAIDTVIQEVNGEGFWLVNDEGLRVGLKANTPRITEPVFDVVVSVQGENVPPLSKTVRVGLGFPLPAIHGTGAVQAPNATREFRPRDDAGELAQRCHMLAASIERWAQRFKDQESETAERMVDEWVEAEPAVDRAEVRRKAYTRNEKNWEADYALRFGAEARKLFDQAYELGEIAKEHARLATRPLAIEFRQVPKLFNEIAESLYAASESPAASG